ncbi:MAG: NAD(P)/FAD-dependent oxidoreductase [Oscillospiraceae bacterium]
MVYDIVIIGSGSAGLTAAIYAQRAQLSAVVLEKDYLSTGQIANSDRVENYPGLYGLSGYDLGEKFRDHAVELGAQFISGEAKRIFKTGENWKIEYTDEYGRETEFETKTIIYAAGAAHRQLGIEGEKLLGVSYCAVCDGFFYRGKRVAVVGGGDTALGEALYLAKTSEKVYLIHRRDKFRASASLQKKVAQTENIEVVLDAVPKKIIGGDHVTGIVLDVRGEEREIELSGIFVAVGMIAQSGLLDGVCELENGYVKAGEDCVTSAEGIFAAGDVRTKALRQVITAAADGAVSVDSAEKYISSMND